MARLRSNGPSILGNEVSTPETGAVLRGDEDRRCQRLNEETSTNSQPGERGTEVSLGEVGMDLEPTPRGARSDGVESIEAMGFTRTQAIRALQVHQNVALAVNFLLEGGAGTSEDEAGNSSGDEEGGVSEEGEEGVQRNRALLQSTVPSEEDRELEDIGRLFQGVLDDESQAVEHSDSRKNSLMEPQGSCSDGCPHGERGTDKHQATTTVPVMKPLSFMNRNGVSEPNVGQTADPTIASTFLPMMEETYDAELAKAIYMSLDSNPK